MQNPDSNNAFMKGPKRKRLAKACDACHKSKRRCDGTAPCSNCYYASKQCTYTDASGRPVPAPRPFKPERQDPQSSSSTSDSRSYAASQFSQPSNQFRIYSNPPPPPAPFPNDNGDDDHKHARKRFRTERGNPMPVDDLIIDGPISGVSMDRPTSIDLDPSLTRELTNLFFTHCHPARLVIHKPTFSSSLSHNRVPSHLLLAVCGLAAPLSKQPRIRTTPARFAGKPFAQEALSQMFDGAGRLVVEPDLATAQALCVLQMHDILILTREKGVIWSSRFHDLALQIVEGLGVHSPEHPTLTPVPSQEFVQRAIERESIRRIFWFIHFLDVMASIYFKKPVTFADVELRLRLPVDETSFELGVHSTLPEYLYLPAVRTQYTSEFGHLIRIISIYAKLEFILDEVNETIPLPSGALMDAEQKMDEWDRTLPEHLRFSEQSLLVQQSMFETSSNAGAWCWCAMHIYHASCGLVLNLARQRNQSGAKAELQWALERIELILQMLGDRAKNSILMGVALWSLFKYCKRDDAQVRKWSADYEEAYGTKMQELVQDWLSQPSPPQQHQYPGPSHPHSQPQQLQPQPQHSGAYHTPHQLQHQQQSLSHRRLSDGRNPVTQGIFVHSSRPQQHAIDAYGNNNALILKRSPSKSPPMSYPLGRPPNNLNSNRSIGTNQQQLADTSISSSASDRAGQVSSLNSASVSAGSAGTFGPGLVHGNGSSGEMATSLAQNQQQQASKYGSSGSSSSREGNLSTHPQPHTRWSQSGGESVVGSVGEGSGSAMQLGSYSGSGDRMSGPGLPVDVGSGPGGVGVGSGSGNSGYRVFAPVGDGNHSLPSLKASGLLDSWGTASRDAQKQVSNGAQKQQPPHISPRRNTPPIGMSLSVVAASQHALHADSTELRQSTSLAMPVGLPWLAHESR